MHRASRSVFLLPLLIACSSSSGSPSVEPEPETPAPAPPARLAGQEDVDVLTPTAAAVSFDALPEPARAAAAPPPVEVVARPEGARLAVPDGFVVQRYAEGLGRADALAVGPSGAVFVVDTAHHTIRRLVDADHDGVAEATEDFGDASNGLDRPGALVFTPGAVFVAQRGAVIRHALPEGQLRLEGEGGRVASFPAAELRAGPALVLAPDRRHLLVGIAAGGRVARPDPLAGSILEINFSGSQRRVLAAGLHDPTGLAFRGGALYAAVAEREDLTVGSVPDFLAQVRDGAFYGWPTRLLGADRIDPRGGADPRSGETRAPEVLLPPGARATALAFGGAALPERYREGALVALAGSRAEAPRVIFVALDADGTPSPRFEEVLVGFAAGSDPAAVWGRPSALLTHPDGSLLVADGEGGHVFRVTAAR